MESCFFVGFPHILLAPSQCCSHFFFYSRHHKLLQARRNTSGDPTPQGRHVCLHDGESHAGNQQSLQEAPFVHCGRPHPAHCYATSRCSPVMDLMVICYFNILELDGISNEMDPFIRISLVKAVHGCGYYC